MIRKDSDGRIVTTIATVLEALPFNGERPSIDSVTRAAARTWLIRMGMDGKAAIALSVATLTDCYMDAGAYRAATGNEPDKAKATDIAKGDYKPRNEKLVAMLEGKADGHAAEARDTANDTATDDTATNDTAEAATETASVQVTGDDTGDLAAILKRILSKPTVNEARVLELIAKHGGARETVIHHQVTIASDGVATKIDGYCHPQLADLATIMGSRMKNGFTPNILLVGDTASGKTHAVRQVAIAMGRAYGMHGTCSMAHELMGYKDAAGVFQETEFFKAFVMGHICALDEIDGWDSNASIAANAPLANDCAGFPHGMFDRHVNSIFVGCANTDMSGATAEYTGRTKHDKALKSRFPVVLNWKRDVAVEHFISDNNAWVTRVVAARERAKVAGIKHAIDPRHSQAGAALIAAGMDPDTVARVTYLAGLTDAQIRTVEGR